MKIQKTQILFFLLISLLIPFSGFSQTIQSSKIHNLLEKEYPYLENLCKYLHSHPELSFKEKETSERLAGELEKIGFVVTKNVGGFGVVGVLKNGRGPTIMVRTDMDALPVEEQTGLDYASKIRTKDDQGKEVSVMHACGHDIHMTVFTGTAKLLSQMKSDWQGTLMMVAQPAEESGGGAKAMLADGLFNIFPRPNFALALHVSPTLPAGSVGLVEGYVLANVDAVDVTVYGVGGHGAVPDATIDPVVLAARLVLALQTIVSRELSPIDPAVVTVGSIHGGTKHNIIPEEVHLQLTIRSYSDEVRNHIMKSIKRIANGIAVSAGLPEDRMPVVTIGDEYTPATYNNPELTRRIGKTFEEILGKENIYIEKPIMAGEDFGRYGKVEPKIPICLFWLGTVNRDDYKRSQETGELLPSLHSSKFAPDMEPTIKSGVKAMTSAVLGLIGKTEKSK